MKAQIKTHLQQRFRSFSRFDIPSEKLLLSKGELLRVAIRLTTIQNTANVLMYVMKCTLL